MNERTELLTSYHEVFLDLFVGQAEASLKLAEQLSAVDSRRLFFTLAHGPAYAAAADAMAIVSGWTGLAKSALLGRLRTHVPHFLRDLIVATGHVTGQPHITRGRIETQMRQISNVAAHRILLRF